MKKFIIAFGLFMSANAFATTYCAVPVGSPDVFHDVQKFSIESNDGYEISWPVHGDCVVHDRYLQCKMTVNGSVYEIVVDLGKASGTEYQKAGSIVKKAKFYRDDISPISCLTR